MNQQGNDTAYPEKQDALWKQVNPPLASFYVLLSVFQYLFCRIAVEPLIGNAWAHLAFLIMFAPLTTYFLWERPIGGKLEVVWLKIADFLKGHPEIWFAVRIIVEIATILAILYFLSSRLGWITVVEWDWLKRLLPWVFLIDTLVSFLAIYGSKKTQESIRLNVRSAFQGLENFVNNDSIKEVFYLTSIVSVIMKTILVTVVVAGVAGAYGIVAGILIVILPYFLFSVLYTALVITGSFGATVRYWQWLLTEPPKIVVRWIFKINRDKVRCYHCERIIPLVGTYECSKCHFKYKGHYFNWCPSCYSRFTYIDCECGLSRKRPFIH
ncbi:hypothetical protein K8T06_10820 [bacterium]|nr:hypothetical protein [bacterium]